MANINKIKVGDTEYEVIGVEKDYIIYWDHIMEDYDLCDRGSFNIMNIKVKIGTPIIAEDWFDSKQREFSSLIELFYELELMLITEPQA